jgi:G3E family GTPase
LARDGRFDYLLIESTGIAEPLPVAETFTFEDEQGRSLSSLAKLDTMVTVVDALNFSRDYFSMDELADRGMSLGDDDTRTVVDLLVDQIEFADVIVISKADLVSETVLNRVLEIVKGLNPGADVVLGRNGEIDLKRILNTGRFDFEKASRAPGWLKALRGEIHSEVDEYGISNFVYRRRLPFHPGRLAELLQSGRLDSIHRSKGFVWVASRHDMAGAWSHAGMFFSLDPAGTWWAATPKSEWPDHEEVQAAIDEAWQEPWGDRRQEVVFIGGPAMDRDELEEALDECLLTPGEMAEGPDRWARYADALTVWERVPAEDS